LGSVKDLIVLESPTEERLGRGRFVFSDRYSVFDWGEMPDHLRNKGKSLCLIGAYFFEKLESMGVKTHYLGLVENQKLKKISELESPVETMEVKLVRVLEPQIKEGKYDYSDYKSQSGNFLLPLEIIYRNTLPEGSSVFKRLKEGSLKTKDLGLKEEPRPGQKIDPPFLDLSTKLEITDRYLSWEEAQKIAGLKLEEIKELRRLVSIIEKLITTEVNRLGMVNEDGKVEMALDEKRNLMVVDVLGTPDECRFSYQGMPVSKELARIFYRQTLWYKEVEEAKRKERLNWKSLVSSPPPLPPQLSLLISQLYQSFCNELTERKWFEAPPLEEVLNEIQKVFNF